MLRINIGIRSDEQPYKEIYVPKPDLILAFSKTKWQVADRLTQILSDRLIAKDLGVKPQTVRFHISEILKKLKLSNRKEFVVLLWSASAVDCAGDTNSARTKLRVHPTFTNRQLKILGPLLECKSSKAIAHRTGIDVKIVNAEIIRMREMLGVNRRIGIIKKMLASGVFQQNMVLLPSVARTSAPVQEARVNAL